VGLCFFVCEVDEADRRRCVEWEVEFVFFCCVYGGVCMLGYVDCFCVVVWFGCGRPLSCPLRQVGAQVRDHPVCVECEERELPVV